jgi:hypothetical protein
MEAAMKTRRTRREFLSAVGQGMLVAGVGAGVASDLGLRLAWAEEGDKPLSFGPLEPLVALMQETPIDRLLPTLADELRRGTDLKQLVAAAALANARTFGGEDYVGFHTMMALAPAWHMAQEIDEARRPLPVFKVRAAPLCKPPFARRICATPNGPWPRRRKARPAMPSTTSCSPFRTAPKCTAS